MSLQHTIELPVLDYINLLCRQAQQASRQALSLTSSQKNTWLSILSCTLQESQANILEQNAKDIQLAKSKKIHEALVDRLRLDDVRFQSMIDSIETIISLNDPIGEVEQLGFRPSGIQVGRMRAPIGVIGMVYESRPNVTIDAAILSVKSSNAVILRGGSEAFHSNIALFRVMQQALIRAGLPEHMVQYVENTSRESVTHLIRASEYIDLIIPRGGKSLIEKIAQDSRINVLKHLDGNCHVYVDDSADLAMAATILWNAKTRRYGVCNAMESLLVHRDIATALLPDVLQRLSQHGVSLRLCKQSMTYAKHLENTKEATEQDWYTEYLGPILSVKIVDDLDQAIDHINTYGSHHTDAIITNNYSNNRQFLMRVDSSSVIVNASTTFADGAEYGLGSEIGVSTDKFHARGPVGLEGLTCQKYIVLGNGEVRP